MIGLNESVRAVIQSALGLAANELEVLVRVSPTGWSHRLPSLRHFAYRGHELVACVKQIPKQRGSDAACVGACYSRFTDRPSFTVPRLLGTAEDAEHVYYIEEAVPARSLATLMASGALSAEAAGAVLDAVLLDVWAMAGEVEDSRVRQSANALRAAADAVFGDELMHALAMAAVAELERAHRAELRTVLTTHDITAANVLHGGGRTWLTDFDLAAETAFFGIDYVRAWFHSPPLRAPQAAPPFTSPDAYRLYRALYPILEYHLQAPHLPPPLREELRRYTQDLFIRIALPEYHGRATFQPVGRIENPPRAQLFLASDRAAFSESESLRIPFDVDSGRLVDTLVLGTEHPVRYIRLDPTDTAQSVVVMHAFTVRRGTGADAFVLDVGTRCRAAAEHTSTGIELVNLLPVPGSPGAFWSTTDDPQIIVDLGTSSSGAYTVALELEVVRDWKRQPAFDPSALLTPLHGRITSLCGALDEAASRAAALHAENRLLARALREVEAATPAAPVAPAVTSPAAVLRDVMRRPRPFLSALITQAPVLAAQAARGLAARAAAALRGQPQSVPAAGLAPSSSGGAWLVPSVVSGRPWPAPLISLLVRYDATPAAEEEDVLAWLATQTCQSVEVIAWSPGVGQAWEVHHPNAVWAARNWDELRHTLAGRYIVVANPDLLAQPPTYLEYNAVALETEALAVTVNVRADAGPALARLAAGRSTSRGVAQVVRVDCLSADLGLDLSGCAPAQGAAVVGKVLVHTTARVDSDTLPVDAPVVGAGLDTLGVHVLARRGADADALSEPIPQTLRPADAVLDLPPLPSALPTVLVVFPFLALGGAERVALNCMRLLRERIRFVVVSVEPHVAHLGTTADAFREVTPFVYTAPDFLHFALTFSLFAYLIRRFAPQTLYVANGAAWIYDALPTLKQRYPHLRALNQVYDHQVGWIGRYDAALVAALDGHIVSNERIAAAVRERGALAATVHLIVNGVDLEEHDADRYSPAERRELRVRFGLAPDRRVVAFFARLHQQKRPMDFVELARQFADDPTVVFFMVGDGPLGAVVSEQIKRLGLRNIVQHPFHKPFSELLAVTDLLVLPSEYEGMPMVILEALAMGVPVVATDVGNNREVLERSGGGTVVHIGDVVALRRAVQQMLAHPPDPAALRAAMQREFQLAPMAEAYYRAFTGADVPGGEGTDR